ncbi:MAG TPA: IclR family transcriptional regulator [Sporolactobacillaceae bacterium]|nr:IclR family transcriptional regulator [Sporolactobacillaceae bacterium]
MPLIQSVERALEIIDLFDEYSTELKITEISNRLNLNKSTIHSLLKTLQKHGYIQQDRETGKYKLGLKLFERGNLAIQNLDIRAVCRKYLLEISKQTGHTLHLVIMDGKDAVYIDKIEGTSANVIYSRVGRRAPLHSTGAGKALVAFKAEEEWERIFDGYDLEKHTPQTITDKHALFEELNRIREQGFSYDKEENELGISCIAVPIRDHTGQVVAASSISMPTPKLKNETERLLPLMMEAGENISKELGYRP